MSGATPTTQEPESFAPRPPDDFDDHFTDHEFATPHHPPSRSDRGLLRHGMNAISMERIEGIPPPPSSFNGPAATGYNYQGQNSANKFAKRKQSITAASLVEDPALCAIVLTLISVIIIIVSLPFSLFFCIKVVQEYERAVIFRLGRLVTGGARGPGIFFIIPCIDTYSKADLRTVSFDVPPQEILSRDSVTVAVDAVVYFRISNAIASVSNVEDYARSTRLLAATTLRNVLGTKNLSEILSERESISHMIQSALDDATDTWGVKVERVEIKDVRLPVQLQRAMAAEAEATREARAKVIAAEGEQRASRALKEAAEVIACSPAALQLRYLQTLNSIASERNSTIVFPVPMELFRGYAQPAHSAPASLPPPSVAGVHIETSNALSGNFENLSTTPLPPMGATPMAQLETISSSGNSGSKLDKLTPTVTSSGGGLIDKSSNLPSSITSSTGCTHTSGSHPYPAPLPPTLVSRSITSTTNSSMRPPPEKPTRGSNTNLPEAPVVD